MNFFSRDTSLDVDLENFDIDDVHAIIKYARYSKDTHDVLLILGTNIGQFILDIVDCSFSGERDVILFLFSRKNIKNRVENFDLKIDNSKKYRDRNTKIIQEFNERKVKKLQWIESNKQKNNEP